MPKRPKRPKRRSPHKGGAPKHDSGLRFAKLVHHLHSSPLGASLEETEEVLGIGERSLQRYLRRLRAGLVDGFGNPVIEDVRTGDGKRFLRIAKSAGKKIRADAYEILSLFLAMRTLRCLDETILENALENVRRRIEGTIDAGLRVHGPLASLDRKLHSVGAFTKRYGRMKGVIPTLLEGLLREERLRIDYAGVHGEPKTHDFDPYTLAEHRGGLYLIGKSHLHGKVVWFAIERIQSVEKVKNAAGEIARFPYPSTYRPGKFTEGLFGVFEGDPVDVALLVHNEATERFLRARRIHATEKYEQNEDGKAILRMRVKGTVEVRNWVLGFGPWLEVLEPEDLRREVGKLHAEAARQYRRRSR